MDPEIQKSETKSGASLDTADKGNVDKTQQPDNKGGDKPTFESTITKGYEEILKKQQSSQDEVVGDKKKPESDSKVESDEGEEKQEEVDGEKEPSVDEKDDEDEEPKGPVPLERFQEVTSENRELKQQVESYQEVAKAHGSVVQYCQQNGLTADDFQQALNMAALLKRDPVEFGKQMEQVLEGVGIYRGDKLPQDLAKEVEEGTLSQERAKEIAQLRAQKQFGENKFKLTQEQIAKQKAEEVRQKTAQAMSDWRVAKQKEFPDFKQKVNGKPDGFFEQVDDKISALMQQVNQDGSWKYPINTPQDAVNLMEHAFKAVHESIKARQPRKPATKHLSSNGSSTTSSNKDPMKAKTFEEAIALKAAELGIS